MSIPINMSKIPYRFRGKDVIFFGDIELIRKAQVQLMGHPVGNLFRISKSGDYGQTHSLTFYREEREFRHYSFHDIREWFISDVIEEYV